LTNKKCYLSAINIELIGTIKLSNRRLGVVTKDLVASRLKRRLDMH
jgi:hypothetical protein